MAEWLQKENAFHHLELDAPCIPSLSEQRKQCMWLFYETPKATNVELSNFKITGNSGWVFSNTFSNFGGKGVVSPRVSVRKIERGMLCAFIKIGTAKQTRKIMELDAFLVFL